MDTNPDYKRQGVNCSLEAAAILAFIVYAFPCWIVFAFFLGGSEAFMSDDYLRNAFLALLCCGLLLLVPALGIMAMRYSLRTMVDKVAVTAWALLGAALAPFSSIAYGIVVVYLLRLTSRTGYRVNTEDIAPYVISCIIGFYMPFVLLTFWLKYKHRQDEF